MEEKDAVAWIPIGGAAAWSGYHIWKYRVHVPAAKGKPVTGSPAEKIIQVFGLNNLKSATPNSSSQDPTAIADGDGSS